MHKNEGSIEDMLIKSYSCQWASEGSEWAEAAVVRVVGKEWSTSHGRSFFKNLTNKYIIIVFYYRSQFFYLFMRPLSTFSFLFFFLIFFLFFKIYHYLVVQSSIRDLVEDKCGELEPPLSPILNKLKYILLFIINRYYQIIVNIMCNAFKFCII